MTSRLAGEPMSQRSVAVVMQTKLANPCQPIIGRCVFRSAPSAKPARRTPNVRAPIWAFCSLAQLRAIPSAGLFCFQFS
jgi:hypothetical protein